MAIAWRSHFESVIRVLDMEARPPAITFPLADPPRVLFNKTVPIDLAFPTEAANKLAEPESFNKHLFRPTTYLRKWWARRSGTTFSYNSFVVHSENPISAHIMNLRSLKHDTILVLKPFGSREEERWQKPEPVEDFASYSFSKACGQMTGWVLETDLSEPEIIEVWGDFLKG